ncbi:MAG: hypothetical protein PVG66_09115 [Chromatiales bacterium]|jgi:hypothetical protein
MKLFTRKGVYLAAALLLVGLAMSAISSNRFFDEEVGTWIYQRIIGPWTIETLEGDENGQKLFILSRQGWGNVGLSGEGWSHGKPEVSISKLRRQRSQWRSHCA